jgi:hypothetical protein
LADIDVVSWNHQRGQLRMLPSAECDIAPVPRPVLLAVDQELGEGEGLEVPSVRADRVCPIEVGQHQDVEQLGAGSGVERVETLL